MWKPAVDQATENHIAQAAAPAANDSSVRSHAVYGRLFDVKVPVEIEGFSLDPEERKRMSQYWHAGEDAAHQVRHRQIGLHTGTH